MANVKISELPSLSTMTDAGEIPVVAGGTTQQITGANLKPFFTANVGFTGNTMYDLNGLNVNNSDLSHGFTAGVTVPSNGNTTAPMQLTNTYGNITIGTGPSSTVTSTWNFDTAGNLTIPNGGYINFVNTGGITQAVNEDLRFTVSDNEQDGWAVQSIVNDGAGNNLTQMQVRYDGVRINTDLPTNNYSFDFRNTGEFDVPKSIRGPVGGNLVISIGDQFGAGPTFIDLQTRSYVGDALISNIRIGDPNVTISTASGAQNWSFGSTGNLTLPLSGNIVGLTANNNGYLNWFGNSSGDGAGYTTMRLIPDATRENADQYLIIDPTAPGHIHIRAGGPQDNSGADLILGGENSYFKVAAGSNSVATIASNSNVWQFGTDGSLAVPGPMSLAVYANATVRDSSITSPLPGMMIYVTGTGMQVRGATQWNTVAGTGT